VTRTDERTNIQTVAIRKRREQPNPYKKKALQAVGRRPSLFTLLSTLCNNASTVSWKGFCEAKYQESVEPSSGGGAEWVGARTMKGREFVCVCVWRFRRGAREAAEEESE